MSHVATGEHVVAPLVGVRQNARNRFFIKNSPTPRANGPKRLYFALFYAILSIASIRGIWRQEAALTPNYCSCNARTKRQLYCF